MGNFGEPWKWKAIGEGMPRGKYDNKADPSNCL
jgi:hypothetical protein